MWGWTKKDRELLGRIETRLEILSISSKVLEMHAELSHHHNELIYHALLQLVEIEGKAHSITPTSHTPMLYQFYNDIHAVKNLPNLDERLAKLDELRETWRKKLSPVE